MKFDPMVHGFWILGSIFLAVSILLLGNIEFVEGTTQFSFWFTVVLAFALILATGVLWISAAVNARR